MRQREREFDQLGVRVVVVTFQGHSVAKAYASETDLKWPIVIDESLSLYQAYGMERGRLWDVWGPESWWSYAKLLSKGRRLRRLTGDPNQLGGDVLIDPGGIVRLHHIGRGPADRPSVDSILDVVVRNTDD